MQILRNIAEVKDFLILNQGKEIGFVPTMGALHAGHESLIKKSVQDNEVSIVSVFVNPTQFLAGEDLENYPRDEAHDIEVAKAAGADAIFLPKVSQMYPSDISIKAPSALASILEGATRPGHFDGVCTVLAKFFNIIRPMRAYFGKKDTQQLIIVQNLVKSLFFDIEIVPCDIIRAGDGLALSSRNSYLGESELIEACKLYRALVKAKALVSAGTFSSDVIKAEMAKVLDPLKIDYIEICDRELNSINQIQTDKSIILIAAYVGKTRLIDNLWL